MILSFLIELCCITFLFTGLFTLILAAIFPSNSSDRFTLSKLLAVALRYVNDSGVFELRRTC